MKIRTWMSDDRDDFTHLPTLDFRGLGKGVVTALLLGVGMFFFTYNAHAQVGWTNTTTTGDTSVVIAGDTTTTGTGTDITGVEGNGGTLTITLTDDSSVGSTSGAIIVDDVAISNPGSGAEDTTTTVVLDSGSSVTVADSGTGAVGVSLEGGAVVSNSGTIETTATGSDFTAGIEDVITNPASTMATIEVTNEADGTITVTGGSGGAEGIDVSNTDGSTTGLVAVTNEGTITVEGTGGGLAEGINAENTGTGDVIVSDSGDITVTGTGGTSAEGINAETSGTGDTTVTVGDTATITVTDTGGTNAEGIIASGDTTGMVSVTDNGTIIVEGTNVTTTEGITAENTGTGKTTVIVGDTATVTVNGTGGTETEGIDASGDSAGEVTVVDSGTITVTGTDGTSAEGIVAENTGTGGVTVTNDGTLAVEGDGGTTIGIDATTDSGTIDITNGGTITVGNTNGGVDGILATTTSGSIQITDSGAINAAGGTAIAAGGSASTPISITLNGAAAINGTINGNINFANPTGSILHLNLAGISVAVANTANTYLAANPNNGSLVINGVTYTYRDFTGVTSDFFSFSTVPGFTSMGNVLDSFNHTNPQVQTLINALAVIPQGGLPQALSELSPVKAFQQLTTSAFTNTIFENTKLDSHLENVHNGLTEGFDWTGLSIASVDEPLLGRLLAYNPAAPAQRTASDTPAHSLAATAAQQFNRWGGFISGNAVLADQDAIGSQPHQNSTTLDVTAGVDYGIDPNWTIGFLIGYGNTSADLDNLGSKTHTNTYRFGPYASYDQGNWYVNGHADFGFNQQSINRNIPFLDTAAHSNPDGDQYGVGFDGGYEFHSGNLTYGPIAGAQYTHLDVNSYTETGAGAANLNVGHETADSFITSLGVKLNYDYHCKWNNSTMRPEINASWQHECLNDSRVLSAAFDVPGSASFTVATANPERDSALLGVGISDIFPNGSLLFISYFAQAGQSDYFAQSITGGFRLSF